MVNKFSIVLLLLLPLVAFAQQSSYKEMMEDYSINFYTVCEAAEAYFEKVGKEDNRSEWKKFQRWRNEHEAKYYPSGDRTAHDPYAPIKIYQNFLSNYAEARSVTDTWKEIGPTKDVKGLGRIEDFYVDSNDPNLMYFASKSGGFWKSTDGGANWIGSTTDFLYPATGVNTFAVSPTNPDSILINVRHSANGTSYGIYRSSDGGATWLPTSFNQLSLGTGGLGTNFQITLVDYHPLTPNQVFIATNQGLYLSADDLLSWTKVVDKKVVDIDFHPTDPSIMYVYSEDNPYKNKVLRSTNGGATFSPSAEIIGNNSKTNARLATSPNCPDCVYFGGNDGIWRSTDAGLTYDFLVDPGTKSIGIAVNDLDTTYLITGGIN
ncbi:MAG: hypothetical protein AAFP19_24880, partial [Bacteroidota bacterium]